MTPQSMTHSSSFLDLSDQAATEPPSRSAGRSPNQSENWESTDWIWPLGSSHSVAVFSRSGAAWKNAVGNPDSDHDRVALPCDVSGECLQGGILQVGIVLHCLPLIAMRDGDTEKRPEDRQATRVTGGSGKIW